MRKLTYYVGCSVDGYIAAADGSPDAFYPLPEGLLEYIVSEFPQTLPTHLHGPVGVSDLGDRFDTVVMGRATYDFGLKEGITSPYAHLKQYVVSGSLVSPDAAVTVVADPVETVRELKARAGGGIWLAGGGRLAAALLPEIDELVLKVYPFVLGTGIGVFGGGIPPTRLALTDTHVLDSGAVIQTYLRK